MTINGNPATDSGGRRGLADFDNNAVIVLIIGWSVLAFLVVFLLNNYLTFWLDWPGALGINGDAGSLRSWLQTGFYGAGIAFAAYYVLKNRRHSLRVQSKHVSVINLFVIRAGFWAVLLVGLADMSLSFLRVEGLLENFAGDALASNLIRAEFRGQYVHMPLVALSVLIAALTRTIGIIWLALLIVIAQLLIVLFRFVFSYEQVFMSDLVRFWYAALFLFACSYTLLSNNHVRVDVLYVGLTSKAKGLVNAVGTLVLGMPFCWVILIIGTFDRTAIINSALLGFEITDTGYGMYVKYLLSVFPGFFASSMLIQFVGCLFEGAADYREEPDIRTHIAYSIQ
jgi:TRAP-type mannitol/chloroaromatic compound transport system permease small subunit